MVNSDTVARRVSVMQDQTRFEYTLPAQSVATFVWNPDQTGKPANTTSSPFVKEPSTTVTNGARGERKVIE